MKLRAGAVHVWRVDLDALPGEIERLLDSGERERAFRIVREPARQRWIAARGALRVLLGSCLGERPGGLRFRSGERGKPALDLPEQERLHFNLSHSGGIALYALTHTSPVGIDVELVRHRPNAVAIAARAFGEPAAARLMALDGEARDRELLRMWVRYEAQRKWAGTGIGGAHMGAHPPAPDAHLPHPPPTPHAPHHLLPGSWICELDVGTGAVAALAASERAEVVRESGAVLERQFGGDLAQARGGAVAL
jgi:phosphopantetheinyl transferase